MRTHARWLALQALFSFLVSIGCMLARPIPLLYGAAAWGLTPACALLSASFIVPRGVNPYLAWLMPPCMWALAGYLITLGYSPDAGVMLLCALAALTGAAAGDVRAKARAGKHKNKRR